MDGGISTWDESDYNKENIQLCVKKIKDDSYRKLILIFTALGGIAILFN